MTDKIDYSAMSMEEFEELYKKSLAKGTKQNEPESQVVSKINIVKEEFPVLLLDKKIMLLVNILFQWGC